MDERDAATDDYRYAYQFTNDGKRFDIFSRYYPFSNFELYKVIKAQCGNPLRFRLTEELNNKDEIISVLKKTSVKEEPPSRCFILEDGTFIDVIGGDLPHAATADYLYKLGLVDKDFITSNIKGYADDTKLISLIKAITCNGYGEFYFRLLKDRPTDAQFKSLTL